MDQSNTLATYLLGWRTYLKPKSIKNFVWSLMSLYLLSNREIIISKFPASHCYTLCSLDPPQNPRKSTPVFSYATPIFPSQTLKTMKINLLPHKPSKPEDAFGAISKVENPFLFSMWISNLTSYLHLLYLGCLLRILYFQHTHFFEKRTQFLYKFRQSVHLIYTFFRWIYTIVYIQPIKCI